MQRDPLLNRGLCEEPLTLCILHLLLLQQSFILLQNTEQKSLNVHLSSHNSIGVHHVSTQSSHS